MTNVHEIRPRIDREAAEEHQRWVTAEALRTAAEQVQRLAEFEKTKPRSSPPKPT